MRPGLFPLLALAGVLLTGCRSVPPLPPVDLQAAGWWILQGQAVWTRRSGDNGVAGELLVATRAGETCFVQFAKPPFTLATAQREAEGWSLEIPSPGRRQSGRRPAPKEVVWFALVAALRGEPPGDGWAYEELPQGNWRLTHATSGEQVEGYLEP